MTSEVSDARDCLAQARRPSIAYGAVLAEGMYIRGVNDSEVPRWDLKGRDERRLAFRRLQWTDEGDSSELGLSVCSSECVCCQRCSLVLSGGVERNRHAASLDLRLVSKRVGELVAVFSPTEVPRNNPCHFNILPRDISIEDMREKIDMIFLDAFRKAKAEATVETFLASYREAVTIELNVAKVCSKCTRPAIGAASRAVSPADASERE